MNTNDRSRLSRDEITENPPAVRARYLETRLLAQVFTGYWQAGARWTTMPRPTLTDAGFDLSYARDATTTSAGPPSRSTTRSPAPRTSATR
ncbi:hypothetical protein ACFYNW_32520 [Streptomyces virginiae]|uniref:hypothetical protein n=1 Tax=Streptomyces virginiae TaxID=1961 RepID=UPI0033AFA4D0